MQRVATGLSPVGSDVSVVNADVIQPMKKKNKLDQLNGLPDKLKKSSKSFSEAWLDTENKVHPKTIF